MLVLKIHFISILIFLEGAEMELVEALVGGRSDLVKPNDVKRTISVDELRDALSLARKTIRDKETSLISLTNDNKEAIQWYHEQTSSISKSIRQLETEIDDLQMPIVDFQQLTSFKKLPIPPSQEWCKERLREYALNEARTLALLKDFEMELGMLEGLSWQGKPLCFNIMISRKTNRLVKALTAGDLPLDIQVDAFNLYLSLISQTMKLQLHGVPHLSALFHNDCQYLAFLILSKDPVTYSRALRSWNQLGSSLLDGHFSRQLSDLLAILQLSQSTEALKQMSTQAFQRVSQIGKLWGPILDSSLFQSIMNAFERTILEWLWACLFSLDCIGESSIPAWRDLVYSVAATKNPSNTDLKRKIIGFADCMEMGLMQLTNRIRRGEYENILTPQECIHLLRALFEDSPSRRACIEEIAQDIFPD